MNLSEVLCVLNMYRGSSTTIQLTTLKGAKDILRQYAGDEYCIVYTTVGNTLGYWLTGVDDLMGCAEINRMRQEASHDDTPWGGCGCMGVQCPAAIARIPDTIMMELINRGFVHTNIDDKELRIQIALGTMPMYRTYQILSEAA